MRHAFETFLERLKDSIDEADFCDVMAAIAGRFDLSSFAYFLLPSTPASKSPRLVSNYPGEWTSHYLQSNYGEVDPVILRAQQSGTPFRWDADFQVGEASREQRKLFDEAAEFGILSGLTIPIHDRHGSVAAVTFASDEVNQPFFRNIERHQMALQLTAVCFHIEYRRKLSGNRMVDGVMLTPREHQCLQWAVKGKSAWEIGCILGISRRTAAFHLENVRKKLGVRTMAQAIARYASSNL